MSQPPDMPDGPRSGMPTTAPTGTPADTPAGTAPGEFGGTSLDLPAAMPSDAAANLSEAPRAMAGPFSGLPARLGRTLGTAGGLILLLTAALTTVSVGRRWLTSQPIPGDFELVSLGSGLAVVCFLAYGTLMRTNIMVDSFTGWLPTRVTEWIDALWTLVWAAVTLVLAERLSVGAAETLRNGTTTMVLGLPTWWAVGVAALGFLATAVVALRWVLWLARPSSRSPALELPHGRDG